MLQLFDKFRKQISKIFNTKQQESLQGIIMHDIQLKEVLVKLGRKTSGFNLGRKSKLENTSVKL